MDTDIVAVTRHCPETHQSVVLVAFTAFSHPNLNSNDYQRDIKPLRVEGVLEEIILEATLNHNDFKTGGNKYGHPANFKKDEKYINGLGQYEVEVREKLQIGDSQFLEEVDSGDPNILQFRFKNFKPGSVIAIRVNLQKKVSDCVQKLREVITTFANDTSEGSLINIVGKMSLTDLNKALYRCDEEERDEGKGFGVYNIPNFGPLVYCGLQGFISMLSTIRASNDLGHPMCGNLRDGNWMIDYIADRLKHCPTTEPLSKWLENNFNHLKQIPRYLVPCYFDVLVTGSYILLVEQCYNLMGEFVRQGSSFVRGLALGSVQCGAIIHSAQLPDLSPNLAPPKPPTRKNEKGETEQACLTLSAGKVTVFLCFAYTFFTLFSLLEFSFIILFFITDSY